MPNKNQGVQPPSNKQGGVQLYEMDSFPRRSITNRLKNVQVLQNKKKMKVF